MVTPRLLTLMLLLLLLLLFLMLPMAMPMALSVVPLGGCLAANAVCAFTLTTLMKAVVRAFMLNACKSELQSKPNSASALGTRYRTGDSISLDCQDPGLSFSEGVVSSRIAGLRCTQIGYIMRYIIEKWENGARWGKMGKLGGGNRELNVDVCFLCYCAPFDTVGTAMYGTSGLPGGGGGAGGGQAPPPPPALSLSLCVSVCLSVCVPARSHSPSLLRDPTFHGRLTGPMGTAATYSPLSKSPQYCLGSICLGTFGTGSDSVIPQWVFGAGVNPQLPASPGTPFIQYKPLPSAFFH